MLAVTNPQKGPEHLDSKSTKDSGPDDSAHLYFFQYDYSNPPVNRNLTPLTEENYNMLINYTSQETLLEHVIVIIFC